MHTRSSSPRRRANDNKIVIVMTIMTVEVDDDTYCGGIILTCVLNATTTTVHYKAIGRVMQKPKRDAGKQNCLCLT